MVARNGDASLLPKPKLFLRFMQHHLEDWMIEECDGDDVTLSGILYVCILSVELKASLRLFFCSLVGSKQAKYSSFEYFVVMASYSFGLSVTYMSKIKI